MGSNFTLKHHLLHIANLINIISKIISLFFHYDIYKFIIYFMKLLLYSFFHKFWLELLLSFIVIFYFVKEKT